jgi:sulfur carrier protein
MNITINGKPQQLAQAKSLSDIVSSYGKNPRAVITELNGTIIPHDQRLHTSLKEGDRLEVVTFVGGG